MRYVSKYPMRLVELTLAHGKHLASHKWKRRQMIEDWLEQHGFRRLGKGSYGSVWTDDTRAVVKIFQNDRCYVAFVKFCRANRGNPHLPRISKVFPFEANSGVVFMEPLQPPSLPRPDLVALETYFDYQREGLNYPDRAALYDKYPTLVDTLDQLSYELPDTCSSDLTQKNMMQRGSTLVITDPTFPSW